MLEKILEEIERLHIRILKDKFAEKVTEQEIEALVAAKEIIRKHMNDGWIPVEKKLPEVEVSENVKSGEYSDNGSKFLITDKEGYVYESTFWAVAQKFDDDAIAWCEKPEPYCPEKGAE